jgi:hypothetical protein
MTEHWGVLWLPLLFIQWSNQLVQLQVNPAVFGVFLNCMGISKNALQFYQVLWRNT